MAIISTFSSSTDKINNQIDAFLLNIFYNI